MNLEEKIKIVEDILKDRKVTIAFSGGADSTLLAYLSSKVSAETLAITIDNHIFPSDFISNVKKAAESFGITHEIIDIDFYKDYDFLSNGAERCFNCRNMMYSAIEKAARERGFDFICDGNNISDLVQDRPGILITYAKGFKTPFIEARLTSREIHEYLNQNDVPYSRSTTCLATRIPTGTPVTMEKINRISYCEDYILDNTDCEIVKVRDLEGIGIVETDDINEILNEDKYNQINDELKGQGFSKVALNLSNIEDNEHINIDYSEGSFSHRLPYTIDLDGTKDELAEIILSDNEKIELPDATIYKNGLVEGHGFESYNEALECFMDILTGLRRNL